MRTEVASLVRGAGGWAAAEARWQAYVGSRGPGCWTWGGSIGANGYGYFGIDGRSLLAHRLMYEREVGEIPDGLTIDHLCRNRSCVNPAHLEAVTGRENTLRGLSTSARNARKARCPAGHAYDARRQSGVRFCRQCGRDGALRRRRAAGIVPHGQEMECRRGHPYTPETVAVEARPGGRSARRCLPCDEISLRRRLERNRQFDVSCSTPGCWRRAHTPTIGLCRPHYDGARHGSYRLGVLAPELATPLLPPPRPLVATPAIQSTTDVELLAYPVPRGHGGAPMA